MRQLLHFCIYILLLCGYALSLHAKKDTLQAASNIRFIENKKQWNEKILFKAELQQGALFVEKNCFTFALNHPDNPNNHPSVNTSKEKGSFKYHAYKLHFLNANNNTTLQGQDTETGYYNYFIGNNPEHWASNVKGYEVVYYNNIYKGIDLKVYSLNSFFKYDFIVHPSALPEQIRLEYEGIEKIQIKNKNLVLHTSVGEIIELSPIVYQILNDKKVLVEAEYIVDKNKVSFKIGKYDSSAVLVIDPMLVFSTYTGSTADNFGYTATYDKKGNVYSGGIVFDQGYPVNTGVYDPTFNGGKYDVAIIKLDPSGRNRLYATYLGGNKADMPHSLFVNDLNELIVYGTTGSDNFPTSLNAYSRTFKGGTRLRYIDQYYDFPNGSDIFVARFNEDGTQLPASTYIGGTKNDGLNYKDSYYAFSPRNVYYFGNDSLYTSYGDGARGELITDDLNNVYVGSTTFSNDFPTTANVFQPSLGGGQDGIVFKLDYNLSNLLWSSYLGGSGDDAVYSIDVDSKYNLIATGGTNSSNFPTTSNAYQTVYNGGSVDGFVTRIAYAGNTILSSTYFGSSQYDQSYFVRTDKQDSIYIAGLTKARGSTLIYNSTASSLYNIPSGSQFIAKFDPVLHSLQWSTVFGSTDSVFCPDLSLTAFSVDNCKRIYLSGWGRIWGGHRMTDVAIAPWNRYGTKQLPITTNAYQTQTDGQDFYLMCLQNNAAGLDYASYFGELHSTTGNTGGFDHVDGGTSRFDKYGTLYQSVCASCYGTQDFPIYPNPGAWSVSNDANCNNAIFSFNVHDDFPAADFILPTSDCAPYTIHFQNTGRGDAFYWDFGDGTQSTNTNPIHTYTLAGLYTVTQIATMPSACIGSDTIRKQIMVLGDTSYCLPDAHICAGLSVQIGLQPMHGITYRWNTSQGLTDSTISNPFATVTQDTRFYLLATNDTCTDTIYQWVRVRFVVINAGDSVTTCNNSQLLNATVILPTPNLKYLWSSNNRFSDTLNSNLYSSSVEVSYSNSQYFYVKVIDNNGCYGIDSIYINFIPLIKGIISTPTSCYGMCDGTAYVSILPTTTQPISIQWSTGTTGDSVQNLCAGNYSVTVTDGTGCVQQIEFIIKQPAEIHFNPTIVNTACNNICSGSISLNPTGGFPPYNFLWDTGDTTSFIDSLCEGSYSVSITDINNCAKDTIFTISIWAGFSVITDIRDNTCHDFCNGKATTTISNTNGRAPFSYQWSNGQTVNTATQLCEGEYTLIVTDVFGCSAYDTIDISDNYILDSMFVWAGRDTIFEGESTTLHAKQITGVEYLWQPFSSLLNPHNANTIAHPKQTTTYYLQTTDSLGCTRFDTLEIMVIIVDCNASDIFVPNAFSPNNDGKNDLLCINTKWITSFHFALFNRWGEKVFETKDPYTCWDGKYKGQFCEQGVYVYTLEATCKTNKSYKTKGDITLIR